jgi:hypothetical protein
MALLLDACAVEVVGAFERAGIESLLLRGPALAAWLYGEHEPRPYTDVDLLVRADDVPRAETVLTGLGFDLLPLPPHDRHAHTWLRADGASVDLHRSLSGAEADPDVVWSVFRRGAQTLIVHGREIATLGAEGCALEVAMHVAQHGRQLEQPLEDLRRALGRADLEVWRNAAELAAEIRAVSAFASGLRRVATGAAIADRLSLPVDERVSTILRSENPPPMALGLDRLATHPGLPAKIAFAASKIFPSPAFMRAWSGVANRGRVGLAAAYAQRFAWLAWHAGPAVRAWVRARRAARRQGER